MKWIGIISFLIAVIGGVYLVANMGLWEKPKDSQDKEGGKDGG